jgi:hypothetical protein
MNRKSVLGCLVAGWVVLAGGNAGHAQDAGRVRVVNQTNRIVRLTSQHWVDTTGKKVDRQVLWLVGPGEQFVLNVDGSPLVAREMQYLVKVGQQEAAGSCRWVGGAEMRIELTSQTLPVPQEPAAPPAAKPAAPVAKPLPLPQDPVLRQRAMLIRQIELQLGGKEDDFFVIGLAGTQVTQRPANTAGNIICTIFAPFTLGASLKGIDTGGPEVRTFTKFEVAQGREAAADLILGHLLKASDKAIAPPSWRIFGRYTNQAAASDACMQLERIYHPDRMPIRP